MLVRHQFGNRMEAPVMGEYVIANTNFADRFHARARHDWRIRSEAAGAPVVVVVGLVVLDCELDRGGRGHASTAGISTSMPCGPSVAMRCVPRAPARTLFRPRTTSSSENERPSYFKMRSLMLIPVSVRMTCPS